MSTAPTTAKPTPAVVAPASSSTSSSSTTAAAKPAAAPSKFALQPIPPFKASGAVNYAQAAGGVKSKPVSPAPSATGAAPSPAPAAAAAATTPAPPAPVNGKPAAAAPPPNAWQGALPSAVGGAAANGTATSPAHSRKQSAAIDVPAPASKPLANPALNFGNVNEKNATVSSSPAAPPTLSGARPQVFGTLPADSKGSPAPAVVSHTPAKATGAKFNLHSLFTGGGGAPATPSPAPSAASASTAAGGPSGDAAGRASVPSFEPQGSRALLQQQQTPGAPPQHYVGGPHGMNSSQLSGNSRPFAPGAPPFAPQHLPHSPQMGQFPGQSGSPYGVNPNQPPYLPFPPPNSANSNNSSGNAKSPAQNIPNGVSSPFGGPAGPQPPRGAAGGGTSPYNPSAMLGGGQGPPHLQRPQGLQAPPSGQQGGPQGRGYGPATSPRTSNVGLPGQPPMGFVPGQYPPNWQQYGQYPPQYYYQQPGPNGGQPQQLSAPPPPGSIAASGASTPSAGMRTPSVSGPSGGPSGHSPAPSLSAHLSSTATPFTPSSHAPSPSPSTTPGPVFTPTHHPGTPSFGGGMSQSGSRMNLSMAAGAAEFKPSASSSAFVPAARVSKAIKIVRPDEAKLAKEKAEKAAAAAAAAAAAEKKTNDDAATATAAADKKVVDDKAAEDKKTADAAAATKKADDEKATVALAAVAAAKKVEEEKAASDKAAVEAEAKKVAAEKEASDKKAKDEADAKAAKEAADAKLAKDEADAKAAKAKAEEEAAAAAATKAKEEEAAKPSVPAVESLRAGADSGATTPSTPGEEVVGIKLKGADAAAFREEEKALEDDEKAALGESTTTNGADAESKDDGEKKVPEPLDLSAAKDEDENAAPMSAALATARPIENLADITYPAEINSPRADLNVNAKPGKFRYDREFLLQFMNVCVEKPEQLPNLEAIGMVDAAMDGRSASFSGQRRGPPGAPAGRPGAMGGGGAFGRSASQGFGAMGQFSHTGPMTSEERFAKSSAAIAGGAGARTASGGFGRNTVPMQRNPSQGSTMPSGFVPAGARGGDRASGRGQKRGGGGDGKRGPMMNQPMMGDFAPLEVSDNRWTATATAGGSSKLPDDSPEMVQRKVKALLNKLTVEKFDSISAQILEWGNKSKDEDDGRILRQVIALVFEKATDEANWSEMYARLCRYLQERLSSEVTDKNVKTGEGVPVAGGALFRKYLLNRCQEDYEAGWKQKEELTAAAASKAEDDLAKKTANEEAEKAQEESGGKAPAKEAELLSDEYYAAQKAKRRGLGLVRFIGELFRLQMLTERIMHECIKKLLANVENPEEEDVESLCRLLTTVGGALDTPKAVKHVDIYFARMKLIQENPKTTSRMRFMLIDVAELRLKGWKSAKESSGPKTISQVHADAQRAEQEASRRVASSSGRGMPSLHDQMSRPGSRRGQARDGFGVPPVGPDGWSAPVPTRPAKAGDLSGLGKIRDSTGISFGPSGHFAAKGGKATGKETPRPQSVSNSFAALAAQEEAASGGRPKLNLAPRTKPLDGEEGDETAGEGDAEGEKAEETEDEDDGAIPVDAVSMSRAEAERKAGNSVTEFFSVRDIGEAVASVEALPTEYRHILVKSLAEKAVDKKAADVGLTKHLFESLKEKEIVTQDDFRKAIAPSVVTMADLCADIPSLPQFIAQLLTGAGFSREEVEELSRTMESEDGEDVEEAAEKLLAQYDKIAGSA